MNDSDYVSVTQAMHELRVPRVRVFARLDAGRLQAAIRDGRQVIERASLERLQRAMRRLGRKPA